MNQKHYQNIYHKHVNVNLMAEIVTQIKSEIINNDASSKIWENIACEKD